MPLVRKERKSEYEDWPKGTLAASPARIELEKLRQLEEMKWLLDDLVDELREIRRQQPPRRLGQRVKG